MLYDLRPGGASIKRISQTAVVWKIQKSQKRTGLRKSRISRWDKFTMHLFFPHLKLACFKIHDILVGNILRALKDWRTLF